MRPARTAAVLAFLVLAAGCAHLPAGSDGRTYDERSAYLTAVTAWELRGRIAIRSGDQAFQGRFVWLQQGDDLSLTVRSPLGTNVLRVSGLPGQLILEARGETRDLDDPERQLSELMGWWLPVMSFREWLLGIPDPGFPAHASRGADGLLESLEQRLWDVRYASYQLAAGVLVPRRIDLAYADLDLRVVVDGWMPSP
jgi:outer membrane lipoprotein LolB